MQNQNDFKSFLNEVREYYKSIGSVQCPALNADVYFTSEGFHHLRFQSNLKERVIQEQRDKLSYLPQAVETITLSATIQEYRITLEPIGLKDSKGYRGMAKVEYYAFWAVLDKKVRVKAVIKQVENGQYNFWSLMPYWKSMNGHKVFWSGEIYND